MDDMINALIALDKKAKQTVKIAEEKRDEMKTQIAAEKGELREGYFEEAKGRIEKMKQHGEEESTRLTQEIEERFRTSADALDVAFEKNRARWVAEIVTRCKQITLAQ